MTSANSSPKTKLPECYWFNAGVNWDPGGVSKNVCVCVCVCVPV